MRALSSLAVLAMSSAMVLAGCGSVSELTKSRVVRSETAVRQAEQTLGNSEEGAMELQRAKDQLNQAQRAVDNDKDTAAARYAQKAELTAELAVARARTAAAQRAADELARSLQALREEARGGTVEQSTDR